MLQIALLLLTCGLSRYMWSVNTSVARVVISFIILSILFYIGVVVAGKSSYECPFQTPASIALRHLRNSEISRKILANLPPPNVISLIHTTWRTTRRFVVSLSPPNTILLIYPTWMERKASCAFRELLKQGLSHKSRVLRVDTAWLVARWKFCWGDE